MIPLTLDERWQFFDFVFCNGVAVKLLQFLGRKVSEPMQ